MCLLLPVRKVVVDVSVILAGACTLGRHAIKRKYPLGFANADGSESPRGTLLTFLTRIDTNPRNREKGGLELAEGCRLHAVEGGLARKATCSRETGFMEDRLARGFRVSKSRSAPNYSGITECFLAPSVNPI